MKRAIYILVALIFFIGILVWIGYSRALENASEVTVDSEVSETDDVAESLGESQTFSSAAFDFSLVYPADWQFESDGEPVPMFSAYLKPAGVPVTPPFDHFANVTHVSFYPEGIPTEGIADQTAPISFDPGFELLQGSTMYVLDDGTPFAAYLLPANKPESWNDAGFVWVRVRVENETMQCFDGAEEIAERECNPLTGHTIVRSGTVNAEAWEEAQDIVRSLEFTTE